MNDVCDRVRGVLLGLAAGDRNGGPIRFAIRLAESLGDCQSFQPSDIFDRYLRWWKAGAFDTGPVAAKVFALVESGVPIREATARVHIDLNERTAGCNPAHRVAPLAMASFVADDDLPGCARAEAALTHRHPLAGDVSAAVVLLCRGLIRGLPWTKAARRAAAVTGPEVRSAVLYPDEMPLSREGYAPEALRASIYFLAHGSNFQQALVDSVQFAGPLNYCPVLVGAVGGARWGAAQIPLDLQMHCGIHADLVRAADRLATQWGGVSRDRSESQEE